jgi:hypothetical protein
MMARETLISEGWSGIIGFGPYLTYRSYLSKS